MKSGTIEVTVKVYLSCDLDSEGDESVIKEVVNAIVDGEIHTMIDNVELVKFETE